MVTITWKQLASEAKKLYR